MTNTLLGAPKTTRTKWIAAGAATAALALGIGAFAVPAANASAEAPTFQVYDEDDSPNPFAITDGLVFYKGADLGWLVDDVAVDDVPAIDYTVAQGDSYAPSFQLIVKSTTPARGYARLVWEPYLQSGLNEDFAGAYTDLQDGVWWTSKIADGPGSQADPQPLSFFADGGAAEWEGTTVWAIDVHQGTTTVATSVVTKVAYDGHDVPLGDADTTPYAQGDVDAATTPLHNTIGQQQTTIAGKDTAIATLQAQVSALNAYKTTHHTADGTNLGVSRAILGTVVAGRTVGVTRSGTIDKATSVKYQWYVNGKAVAGATKSTFKVPSSAKHKPVSVRVTGTYAFVVFSVHSNAVTAK